MAQREDELKFLQTKAAILTSKPKPRRVKSLETTSAIYHDVELITEVPEHLKSWNHENFVGLKGKNGEVVWQNIPFIMSMTFYEGDE